MTTLTIRLYPNVYTFTSFSGKHFCCWTEQNAARLDFFFFKIQLGRSVDQVKLFGGKATLQTDCKPLKSI